MGKGLIGLDLDERLFRLIQSVQKLPRSRPAPGSLHQLRKLRIQTLERLLRIPVLPVGKRLGGNVHGPLGKPSRLPSKARSP